MSDLCAACIDNPDQHTVTVSGPQLVSNPSQDYRGPFGLFGFLLGAIVGFLTRPGAMLVGQLSFSTVISRGGNLNGIDELLVPTAQASFNQMLLLGLVGAAIGVAVGQA